MSKNLIFLDLETTGLDPENCSILEIAMIAYDPKTRTVIDTFTRVLPFPEPLGHTPAIDSYVIEMHTQNGLWLESQALWDSVGRSDAWGQAIADAIEFVQKHTSDLKYGSPMCGNSIGFDRAFLKADMPELEECFQFRNIDVSSLNLISDVFHTQLKRVRTEGGAHRALADCLDSIAQLEGYLDQLDRIGAPS